MLYYIQSLLYGQMLAKTHFSTGLPSRYLNEVDSQITISHADINYACNYAIKKKAKHSSLVQPLLRLS